MSSEISLTINMTCLHGSYNDKWPKGQISISQSTANGTRPNITVTTSDTALSFAGIGTNGLVAVFNQDATNYCTLGPSVSGAIAPFLRVGPGEQQVFRVDPSATIRAQAHTASVILSFWVLEN